MSKSIAFIDCFIKTPVNICVNSFILQSQLPCTYHMPSIYGLESLEQLEHASAYVLLGSASNVCDQLDWHQKVLDFIIPKLEAGIPVLGICFGHQLLASHYGCEVSYIKPEDKDFNRTQVREVKMLQKSLDIEQNDVLDLAFYHSQEVKSISDSFHHIATSNECRVEGLKHKTLPLWSFQAHPEASQEFIQKECEVTAIDKIQNTLLSGNKILAGFVKELSIQS